MQDFIAHDLKRTRKVISAEVMTFFRDHCNCEKFFCTTCGGRSHIAENLEHFLARKGISRVSALCEIVPEELVQKKDWDECLILALRNIPVQLVETVIFESWVDKWGTCPDFDNFLVEQVVPRLQSISPEGEKWALKLLFSPFTESKMNIQNLLSGSKDPEIRVVTQFFTKLKKFQLNKEHDNQEVDFENWRRQFPDKYEQVIINIEKGKKESEIQRQKTREMERIRQEEKLSKENEQNELRKKRINELGKLPPLERFIAIIEDDSLSLTILPVEWSDIETSEFFGLSSGKITELTRKLTEKMKFEEHKSVVMWRDLRSRLFLVRQNVIRSEFEKMKLKA